MTSNIQGIKDYSVDGVTGFSLDPNDINGFSLAMKNCLMIESLEERLEKNNVQAVQKWGVENSTIQLKNIITEFIDE